MGHEFFKSQIGVGRENFNIYWRGYYNFQCQRGGGSCVFVGKSGVGHIKLAF